MSTNTEKLYGWFDRIESDVEASMLRLSEISAQLEAGAYEPKHALADGFKWAQMIWGYWLPAPDKLPPPTLTLTYSKQQHGAKPVTGAVRLRMVAPSGEASVAADLTLQAAPQQYPKQKFDVMRQGRDVVVIANGGDQQPQGKYRGELRVRSETVALLVVNVEP